MYVNFDFSTLYITHDKLYDKLYVLNEITDFDKN